MIMSTNNSSLPIGLAFYSVIKVVLSSVTGLAPDFPTFGSVKSAIPSSITSRALDRVISLALRVVASHASDFFTGLALSNISSRIAYVVIDHTKIHYFFGK